VYLRLRVAAADSNGVVESQTNDLVSWSESNQSIFRGSNEGKFTIFATLVLENGLLEILGERDERAARRVGDAGTVRADSVAAGGRSTSDGGKSDEGEE
jgi:hypothetical protein